MKPIYRYVILTLLVAFLGYHSLYFKKLSEVRKLKSASFNFNAYADSLYFKGILKSNKAVDLNTLLTLVKSNPDSAFKAFGNRLGIGNSAFFMVKSAGKIAEIDDTSIKITTPQKYNISIDTKYIFGNALRDASGLVKLTDFKTNADFNKVSESLNTLIREKIIPPVVKKLKKGDEVVVIGTLKLSKKQPSNPELIIIPTQITLQ